MAESGEHLPCDTCGAPIPLIGVDALVCPFCLHRQAAPAELAQALAADAALGAAYTNALERAEAEGEATVRGASLYVVGIAGLSALGVAVVIALSLGGGLDARGAFGAFGALLFGGAVAFVARAFLAGQRKAQHLRLAQLPCATSAYAAEGFTASCPRCGAPTGASEVTPTCGHCQTVFLLPLPLVAVAHRAVHREIVELRTRGALESATEIAMAANAEYQRTVRGLIPVMSVIFLLGLGLFLGYVYLTQP